MDIKATVKHQFLQISPCVMLAEDSRNYMRMVFDFQTDDWDGTEKTAKFRNPKTEEVYESILDSTGACEIRWEATSDSGIMAVSVFGVDGDYRITTGIASVYLMPTLSGGESDTPPSHDVYQQLLTMLGQKADNMTYSDSVLRLLSGSKELSSVIIAGSGSNIQPDWNQNDSGAADYIKNRPFYDDTNVLLEWDGNTEGLVAAVTVDEVEGFPEGTAVGYKIAEYMDPELFVGATIMLSDGSSLVITEEEIKQAEGVTYAEGLLLTDKAIVAQSVNFPEAGVYVSTVGGAYASKVYTGGIAKLPNKYLNLDTALNEESENPVQNKAVAAAIDKIPVMVVQVSNGKSNYTSQEIWDAIEKGYVVLGLLDSEPYQIYLPQLSGFNENQIAFIGSLNTISGNRGQSDGFTVQANGRIGKLNSEYAYIIPSVGAAKKGQILTIGTSGYNTNAMYWADPPTATDVGALSGTTANSWADVPELLANYDTVLYNADAGSHPEGMQVPALIVASVPEKGTRQLSILDGAGQIWTGSINLSSGTITVKKLDAGIQTLNLGAASDVDIRELEEGIYRVITDSGEINLNGFSGSVAGSGTSVTMATYSTNCLYLAVSKEESSSGITIVVNVMDQAMPTQIVCEVNGTGNYASWTSTKTDIKDICLSKDNTTEYTPTGDYNPATKKYVDDAVGGVSAATPRQQMTTGDTTVTLQPNTLYVFPEMATLAITLATPSNTAVANEYHFFFTSGATATTLTLPDGIVSDMSVEANRRYEASIMDGYLAWTSWEVVAGA
mgnify:CR=1 FL=1